MKLSTLIADLCPDSLHDDMTISRLVLDSREVKKGDLFVAVQGAHLDGRQFVEDAVAKGAAAILIEATSMLISRQETIPVISIPDLKNKLGLIAARFHQFPAEKMQIVGVTGTSGKTSCTQFIANALQQLNHACGVIGTLGNGLYDKIEAGNLTTPDAITLQKLFAGFAEQGAKFTVMEVSSHSLDQGRVNGINFDVGVFTNLTRDHLDYHMTMEAYAEVKKRLFQQTKYAVINADDPVGREILATQKNAIAYTTQPEHVSRYPLVVSADQIKLSDTGIHANISSPWGQGVLHSSLVGQFNLSNLLAALSVLCLLEIPFEKAIASLSQVTSVSGRMQTFGGKQQPLVVVDYAHKPDALEKVLQALRQQCHGKLYCLFGCGGERDRGKRPIMAKIAEIYADQVIVSDDNPRYEDAKQIVADIMQGFLRPGNVIVQHDRSKAIQDVIQCASIGDCILIAGKGAETYQLIGDRKIPFSDIERVQQFLNELGLLTTGLRE